MCNIGFLFDCQLCHRAGHFVVQAEDRQVAGTPVTVMYGCSKALDTYACFCGQVYRKFRGGNVDARLKSQALQSAVSRAASRV